MGYSISLPNYSSITAIKSVNDIANANDNMTIFKILDNKDIFISTKEKCQVRSGKNPNIILSEIKDIGNPR